MHTPRSALPMLLACVCLSACSGPPREQALVSVKQYVQQNLDALVNACTALAAAAPAPSAAGWTPSTAPAAVQQMKSEWRRARLAYEHVEGAIAVLFPELDVSTDQRYDGFIALGPDDNPFDDQGVIGIHAIERILWADSIPARVTEFERGLPFYAPAAFPSNQAQASDFKTKLAARLVADVKQMADDFRPLALDPEAAYRGVIGSMAEQLEKADKAATGEEESRYAQHTLADMRANVEAGGTTYEAFRPWLLEQGGADLDRGIQAGFQRLRAGYAELSGDALPEVPATWSSANPSETDKQTPFGKLYLLVAAEADPHREGSLVHLMNESAELMGIGLLPE